MGWPSSANDAARTFTPSQASFCPGRCTSSCRRWHTQPGTSPLFTRSTDPDAPGTGWVAIGLTVVVVGLLIDLTTPIQILITIAGLISIVFGMWELRVDYPALSRAGRWLVVLGSAGVGRGQLAGDRTEAPHPTRLISANVRIRADRDQGRHSRGRDADEPGRSGASGCDLGTGAGNRVVSILAVRYRG